MNESLIFGWYKRFRANRKRKWYSDKIVGAALPASHLKRPTRRMMLASAKRFAKDGELHNAVEMLRLAYYPKQLKFTFKPGKWL
jgi:hypothetical protein